MFGNKREWQNPTAVTVTEDCIPSGCKTRVEVGKPSWCVELVMRMLKAKLHLATPFKNRPPTKILTIEQMHTITFSQANSN